MVLTKNWQDLLHASGLGVCMWGSVDALQHRSVFYCPFGVIIVILISNLSLIELKV